MWHWYRARGHKQRVLIDFDGVLHHYERWDGNTPTGQPIIGAHEALIELQRNGWEVIIVTARPVRPARRWLRKHGFNGLYRRCTNVKWPAMAFFDDHAIHVKRNEPMALRIAVDEWLSCRRPPRS